MPLPDRQNVLRYVHSFRRSTDIGQKADNNTGAVLSAIVETLRAKLSGAV